MATNLQTLADSSKMHPKLELDGEIVC
jgi:hypothetical protein